MYNCRGFSIVDGERIAIGAMPSGLREFAAIEEAGITHVVNCRATLQTWISQDLWMAREVFGADHVAHAPMWDRGRPQDPERWSDAALFAAQTLADDPDAKVLIHCQQGRRRSAMVAYATLRLRGHDAVEAARLVLTWRPVARIVPAYRASVEKWLETRAVSGNVRRPQS